MSEIPSYFKRYLRAIQPPLSSRQRAKQLHTTLRNRLADDVHYRDVYEESFLYGSYRRNTAIFQIKDVDVCIQLNPSALELPPNTVVDRLRRVLERSGYEAKTNLQRRSVRIDMSGTTLDAVPVVDVTKSRGCFLIPDRKLGEWVPTYPKAHLNSIATRNKECNKRFVPLAKIIKAWFRYQTQGLERPRPKGFTLEALLYEHQDKDAPSYAEAFTNFLGAIDSRFGVLLSNGGFPEVADPARPGVKLKIRVTDTEAKRFGRLVKSSLAKARMALKAETVDESAKAWFEIFGPNFPTKPAITLKSASEEAGDEDIGEEEDEIADTELSESLSGSPLLQALVARQTPTGPINFKLTAKLALSETGPTRENYTSDGRALSKFMWIEFAAPRNVVTGPYEVFWIVENHGHEALVAGDMGHTKSGQSHSTRRRTHYRGSHTMVCELRRDGLALARAKHKVNIK